MKEEERLYLVHESKCSFLKLAANVFLRFCDETYILLLLLTVIIVQQYKTFCRPTRSFKHHWQWPPENDSLFLPSKGAPQGDRFRRMIELLHMLHLSRAPWT